MTVLRYLRAAVGEYYYDLPRMLLLNLEWFVLSLPFLFVAFALLAFFRTVSAEGLAPYLVVYIPAGALTLALAGPATAGAYYVTNRLAHGDLLEVRLFWQGFRRYFVRGWLLALTDVAAIGLLALNIWFYWQQGSVGFRLLSVVFAYGVIFWGLVQPYLFSMLVEMDQGVWLVIRNAVFIVLDNLPLTIGLALVNLALVALSLPLGALLLPFATVALLSNLNNKAVVAAVERYRSQGRIFAGGS